MRKLRTVLFITFLSVNIASATESNSTQFMHFYTHINKTIEMVTKLDEKIKIEVFDESYSEEVRTLKNHVFSFPTTLTILVSTANSYELIDKNKFNEFTAKVYGNYNGLKQGDLIMINQVYTIKTDTQNYMDFHSPKVLEYWQELVGIMRSFYSYETD